MGSTFKKFLSLFETNVRFSAAVLTGLLETQVDKRISLYYKGEELKDDRTPLSELGIVAEDEISAVNHQHAFALRVTVDTGYKYVRKEKNVFTLVDSPKRDDSAV